MTFMMQRVRLGVFYFDQQGLRSLRRDSNGCWKRALIPFFVEEFASEIMKIVPWYHQKNARCLKLRLNFRIVSICVSEEYLPK